MKKRNKEKLKLRLEDWQMYPFYTLRGKVYGHPNFQDGTEVITSKIQIANFPNSVETYNSIYVLGKQINKEN